MVRGSKEREDCLAVEHSLELAADRVLHEEEFRW